MKVSTNLSKQKVESKSQGFGFGKKGGLNNIVLTSFVLKGR